MKYGVLWPNKTWTDRQRGRQTDEWDHVCRYQRHQIANPYSRLAHNVVLGTAHIDSYSNFLFINLCLRILLTNINNMSFDDT